MVTEEEGRQLAEKYGGIPFLEASAAHNVNVNLAFETLWRRSVDKRIPCLSVSEWVGEAVSEWGIVGIRDTTHRDNKTLARVPFGNNFRRSDWLRSDTAFSLGDEWHILHFDWIVLGAPE